MAPEDRNIKDTRLYDVLGVPPTATTHEISVAYRRKREQVRVRRRRPPLVHLFTFPQVQIRLLNRHTNPATDAYLLHTRSHSLSQRRIGQQ